MNVSNVIKTAIGGLLFLLSSQVFSAVSDLAVKSINVPAYNLISDALSNMNAANGKTDDFTMQQICDLARGEKTQQDVNAILEKNKIDMNALPNQGAISSLMVNGNQPAQAYVCATYVATIFSQPTDNSALYTEKKNKQGEAEITLNTERFASDMRLKMSIAQATAQLYAVIAVNLPTDSQSSWADYQSSIANTLFNYAPEYLRLMKKLYISDSAIYSPITITKSAIDAVDNQGRELQITSFGLVFMSRGVVWLGNGKILGMEYFSPVNIIPPIKKETQSGTVMQNNKPKGQQTLSNTSKQPD